MPNEFTQTVRTPTGGRVTVYESAHALSVAFTSNRRITVIRPDGVALELWPAVASVPKDATAPCECPRGGKPVAWCPHHGNKRRRRESDATVMLGFVILWAAVCIGFALGAWIF